jgi:DNA polymerase-3 subunit alpha
MTEKYKLCKLGIEQPEYLSKEYEEISKETFGQIIYQEQVVQILIKLAGFTFLEADKVRKIISKRQGLELLQAYEKTFVDGCIKVGSINSEVATLLWQKLVQFGIYVLNKSHAVGYSLLAYWCAYLKANYPSEWLCGYLNFANTDKENKEGEQEIDIALKEAVRLGIAIKTPDINKSDVIWSVDPNGSLRVGLKDISYVGDSAFELLAKIKARGQIRTFEELLDDKEGTLNKRVLKSMLFCGALDELEFTRINKARLILQFDKYWEAIGSDKKEAKFLESPIPEGSVDIQAIIDREREEYLRFNPIAIHGGHSVQNVAKLLGLPFVESEDGEYIQGKTRQYNRQAVELCQMPDTGVRLVNAVEGSFAKHMSETQACNDCQLRKSCPEPIPFRRGHLDLMIVGETPHSIGGQFHPNDKIWECLREVGIEPNKICVSTVLKCRPPKGVKATEEEIMGCRWLDKELRLIRPKFVLVMGNVGLQYFKGMEKGINSYNAKTEWNSKYNCWTTFSINTASLYFHPENISLLREAVKEFSRAFHQFV